MKQELERARHPIMPLSYQLCMDPARYTGLAARFVDRVAPP